MLQPGENNIIFDTAANFIQNTNHPVFLTGKAGTGKTTFLKYIKENSRKNIVVVAPTGVAAINAGGTTIHSFFQLPFAPFLPSSKEYFTQESVSKNDLISNLRLTSERKAAMQELELLVIDEISMVRCDVLDAIDTVLRHVRHRHTTPFGGVQLLYIGDMFQLPPVVKDEEWKLLQHHYENPYFFSSDVIKKHPPAYIELTKVFRQSDNIFIDILNKVRNNCMGEADLELLHSRYDPAYIQKKEDGYTTLTTHNNKADLINNKALSALAGNVEKFKAKIEGEFNERSFPADELLQLKQGAQVMFIKNDTEKVRRYYNGKIGIVQRIDEDKIWVECGDEQASQLIEVKKETWRNIRYTLNNSSKKIEETELGSFSQFPLRLAWAITIHKSQGLTFDKAIIDAGDAFAYGQVYVALSRCRSLQGIILRSKIPLESLRSDSRIVAFSVQQKDEAAQAELLAVASNRFQQETIRNMFGFTEVSALLRELELWLKQNEGFAKKTETWFTNVNAHMQLFIKHSSKFESELDSIFQDGILPEKNLFLADRLRKAAAWFIEKLDSTATLVLESNAITDNRQLAKDFDNRIELIYQSLCFKKHLLTSCTDQFSLEKYTSVRSCYSKPKFTFSAYSGRSSAVSNDILHPALFYLLKDKRDEFCVEKNLPVYMVCNTHSLELMTNYLPATPAQLGTIPGFGPMRLRQFGNEFLKIIADYCEEHGLQTIMPEELPKKIKKIKPKSSKPDTKKASLDLFNSGKTVNEIATERKLAPSTIESHLGYFVEHGELSINQLVAPENQVAIREVLASEETPKLIQVKEKLPEISYGEIKWMMIHERRMAPAT